MNDRSRKPQFEALVADLRARLGRIAEAGDPDLAEDPDTLGVVDRLIEVFDTRGQTRDARLLADAAVELAADLLDRARRSLDPDPMSAAVAVWRFIVDATPRDHPSRPGRLSELGFALRSWFASSLALTDPDEAIEAGRAAVAATPAGHPHLASVLVSLSTELQARFRRVGATVDLDEAVDTAQAAAAAAAAESYRAVLLCNLAIALCLRYGDSGSMADLDNAIRAATDAVAVVPSGKQYLISLTIRCAALQSKFDSTGAFADLNHLIDAYRLLVAAVPAHEADGAVHRSNLGTALQARFEHTHRLADLDEAIEMGRAAIRTTSDPLSRALHLSNLCSALQTRFERTGMPADLDEAIEAGRAATAISADDDSHAGRLSSLSNALRNRFGMSGSLADLAEAIDLSRKAVAATPSEHPDRVKRMSNHATAVLCRFGRSGTLADLDEAIGILRAAVKDCMVEVPGIMINLLLALQLRFERTGMIADLDEAIEVGREAVATCTPDSLDRPAFLSSIGIVLQTRFERTGALADLDEAVEVGRAAVTTIPADHRDRAGWLSNLGATLLRRFERTGVLADLDEAVATGRAAVAATARDHSDRTIMESNLGAALRLRFQHAGMVSDLDEAVEAGRAAVVATPSDHPDRAARLSNLGIALTARAEHTGVVADLDEAVLLGRAAVAATPSGHTQRAVHLSNLGQTLRTRFRQVRRHTDLAAAGASLIEASEVETAAPSMRVRAARAAGLLLAEVDVGRAAQVLESAVRLLPDMAPRDLVRADQQHALGGISGLAADAAATALSLPEGVEYRPAVRAVRLLEMGRAVMLSQALDTRDDLTELRAQHPGLAARYGEIRQLLDRHASAPGTAGRPKTAGFSVHAVDSGTWDRRSIAAEFGAVVRQIREQKGFAGFGLPPELDGLLAEARQGPIVMFNVSDLRCDALVLTSDGVRPVALPGLTRPALVEQINMFYQALAAAHDTDADRETRLAAQGTLNKILAWLWDNAAEPVLDALGLNSTPVASHSGTGDWPRVWWAPGGLLGMLPIHASGHHSDALDDPHRRTVLDRVVSSYTPTVRALSYARRKASHLGQPSGH
ncbi:hypothetical protein ACIA5G_33560 [Amycolatopsis sp. NPDC051758]|uniref:hypothetical protein n=1 Tax=Amycolatopsis sp. NPDC051758 TaxID=3363935 RepID=UPI0037928D3F